MSDNQVRVNPHRIFFQIRNDKQWKSLIPKDIAMQPAWMPADDPPTLHEDSDEDVTVGHVNKRIASIRRETKELWNDKLLSKLECMSKGCCDQFPSSLSGV